MEAPVFKLADFLIYCVLCAYTPGANNLLSMSNAARVGFRKSIVFNYGITAGFRVLRQTRITQRLRFRKRASVFLIYCNYSVVPKKEVSLRTSPQTGVAIP